ncbi:MAG: cytochrome c biogenesis protein CcsA [Gammaproteobacteria bacterium]|nr:cytochrome c biogenesis protein CcsA [Gammaproteobacteria bacterium]
MELNISTIMLAITAISFYTLVIILATLRWKLANAGRVSGLGTTLSPLWIALILHALLLHNLISVGTEISLGFASSLTLFTWCITLVSAVVALRARLLFLIVITCVFSCLSIVAALVLPVNTGVIEPLSFSLAVHIILSILSYSLLSIAALISILLGFQDYQLHHHQQGQILKLLPPLQSMESLMFRLIETGFVLLSFTVISGFLFADDWFNHKIVFSIIAWLVFLILLLGRHFAGWRGRKAIRWTLAGIVSLMLAFFGTKLVFEFILS